MSGLTREEKVAAYLKKITTPDSLSDVESMVGGAPKFELARGGFEAFEAAPRSDEQLELAMTGLGKTQSEETLNPSESGAMEAIILPKLRPVVLVQKGTYTIQDKLWGHFNKGVVKSRFETAIRSIGRVELPNSHVYPYGGTGFVVGPNLLMTNRHVAELFALGLGTKKLKFKPGETAAVDFKREYQSVESLSLDVDQVLMIHPYWDMALLKVRGLPASIPSLQLSTKAPEDLSGADIAVVGYPARDPRNDSKVQDDVFKGVYNVKRLQPGKVQPRMNTRSFGKVVSAMTHDCSTLGGNSGSALIHSGTGEVVGLHFAGVYLEENFAVPTYELARDKRIVDLGLNFNGHVGPTSAWAKYWTNADGGEAVEDSTDDTGPDGDQRQQPAVIPSSPTATFTIPLHISVSVGQPISGGTTPVVTVDGKPAEQQVEKVPVIFPDLESREGYQSDFLELAGNRKVPLPKLTAAGNGIVARLDDGSPLLNYHRFTLVMHKLRRLALFTASNVDWRPEMRLIDGKKPSRKILNGFTGNEVEDWVTDPRIPQQHQLPDYFYTKDGGAFDRGHLVRRDDVAWGETLDEMQMGNGDTFHTTNCSPQTAEFNQSKFKNFNWGELENLVQKETSTERVCVFSGPVLEPDDKYFHGLVKSGVKVSIQIPSRFWKIIVAKKNGKPAAYGFVLDQDLSDVDLHEEMAVPNAWKKFLRPIAEIESLLGGLATLGPIVQWDQK